jgi:small ligand-binding sensory domain FIST
MAWETTLGDPATFRQILGVPDSPNLFVLLADPFTTPMEAVLGAFNRFYPDAPVVGGMASGSPRAGGNALLLNGELLNNGAVGLALSGPVEIDVIVSQGCRPIGQPLVVTEAQENIIVSLDGVTPLAHLQHLLAELSPEDQGLLQQGLFVGRAIAPDQAGLGRGDFLIRGVMGLDQERGALVIGDRVEPGETIQFHVRDANTATEDLEMMLTPQLFFDPPAGGLLFSCNGRGTRLYDHPDGDISTIQNVVGQVELTGFFCAGEIGPIGGQNFLHGHTASLALFRPQQNELD